MTTKKTDHVPRLPTITGSVIYGWFHHPCSMKVHLDLFGDKEQRVAAGPVGRYLMERGNRHESRIFDEIREQHPDDWAEVPRDPEATDHQADLRRRAVETRRLIKEGVKFIFHGILESLDEDRTPPPSWSGDPTEFRFRGETDILERIEEPTPGLGDFGYIVGDVKSSRSSKLPQKMQVTYYSLLLEEIQGMRPRTGFIITGAGLRESFEIDETVWTLRHFLEEEIHEYANPDRVFYHLEPACGSCGWRELCEQRAQEDDDVSLIPSCRRHEKRALELAGIGSREDLIENGDEELRGLGRAFGKRLDGFRDLKRAAMAQRADRAIVRQRPSRLARQKGGPATPDAFYHQGPILLVSSVVDYYDGRDVLAVSALCRREDFAHDRPMDADGVQFHEDTPDGARPVDMGIIERVTEIDRLLQQRRESALVMFVDGGLPWRLSRLAAENPGPRGVAIERLLADSVTMTQLLERTLFMPVEPRDIHAVAAFLTQKDSLPHARRQEIRLESIVEHGESLRQDEADADAAVACMNEVMIDYDIDPQSMIGTDDDPRTIAVREWRSGGGEGFMTWMRAAALDDIRAARAAWRWLVRMRT